MRQVNFQQAMLALILGMVLTFALRQPAHPHDAHRPNLDKWFGQLTAKGYTGPRSGANCCEGKEATRVEDADWESKDGHYRVRLQGQWYDVPDGSVVEEPNLAGPTMVWPQYNSLGGISGIRCFLPGVMT